MQHTHRDQRAHGRTLRSPLLVGSAELSSRDERTYSQVDTTGYQEF